MDGTLKISHSLPPLPKSNCVEYRHIAGFLGYCVGSDGSVWSARGRGHRRGPFRPWFRMSPNVHRDGYLMVCLSRVRRGHRLFRVHILVLNTFVGPCPKGMEACHYPDRNPTNNHINNLRWDTPSANQEDKRKHGTMLVGAMCPHSTTTEPQTVRICELLQQKYPPWKIAKTVGVSNQVVHQIRSRETWKHVSDAYAFPVPSVRNRASGEANWKYKQYLVDPIRVMELRKQGLSLSAVASVFSVSVSTITRSLKKYLRDRI